MIEERQWAKEYARCYRPSHDQLQELAFSLGMCSCALSMHVIGDYF